MRTFFKVSLLPLNPLADNLLMKLFSFFIVFRALLCCKRLSLLAFSRFGLCSAMQGFDSFVVLSLLCVTKLSVGYT